MSKINSLDGELNAQSLRSQLNASVITANDRTQSQVNTKSKKSSVTETIKIFYLQDVNSVQCLPLYQK